VSLTIVGRALRSRVRIGGEYDRSGRRGFVLLACSPSPCLLTPRAARRVARMLVRFAERTRPTNQRKENATMKKTRRTRRRKAVPDGT
jgi:hypothetical protein